MRLNLSLFALLFFATVFVSFAQKGGPSKNCASMDNLNFRMQEDPTLKGNMDAVEQHTYRVLSAGNNNLNNTAVTTNGLVAGQILTIPVYVHVVYNTAAQNISDAQIQSQMAVLNADFRKTNADVANTPAEFAARAVDTQIQFVLAGVTRKYSSKTSWGTRDAIKKSKSGGVDPITPSTHLNIWVGEIGGGILGYAQFPGGALATDGVVVGPQYFGTTGTATAPFNKGRTATHEVGHWANLRHIWGDANCGNDYVADTPAASGPAYGCPSYPKVSCSTNNMTMNYMDYTDDACMYMFTQGQKDRMRAIFATGGSRASFATAARISGGDVSKVDPIEAAGARGCASHEVYARMMREDANFRTKQAEIEEHAARYEREANSGVTTNGLVAGEILTIPVYVHVLYNTAAQNISDAQIQSQITVLNQDFRKTNADRTKVPSAFSSLAADAQIQFTLAGITRKATTKTSWGTADAIKKSTQGGVDPITPSTHLNIWVGEIGGGILGYAQFPGGALATDGVVIGPKYFGTTGTATAPFNKGRTATHEVGHWMNLRHIWGDANCGNDYVTDTPAASGPAYGCPAYPKTSCGTTNMTMNYMDYTDDACMYMFTTGQKNRMRAIFATGGSRNGFDPNSARGKDTGLIDAKEEAAHKGCASHENYDRMMREDANFRANQARIEEHATAYARTKESEVSTMGLIAGEVLTIPVYVHVVYNTSIQNISDAQIQSQIAVLNQDFRKTNADRTKVPSAFASLAADIQIQFTLAGITRKASTRTSWGTNDDVKKATMGGVNPISPSTHLNMWVAPIGGGILGYAQFPGGPLATDGVVIAPNYFGNTGYVTAPFNKGRTATHEVGHWMNLRHIWGDANCGNDYVTDTPAASGPASGCPAYPKTSCGTTNMTMNYMDYTDDACMYMFTTGQKNRMRAIFATGGSRNSFDPGAASKVGGTLNLSAGADNEVAASKSAFATTFEVYPNPASGEATVQISAASSDLTLTITDIQGKVMHSENVAAAAGTIKRTLDVSRLKGGMYMVNITGKEFKQVKKLVINQ